MPFLVSGLTTRTASCNSLLPPRNSSTPSILLNVTTRVHPSFVGSSATVGCSSALLQNSFLYLMSQMRALNHIFLTAIKPDDLQQHRLTNLQLQIFSTMPCYWLLIVQSIVKNFLS